HSEQHYNAGDDVRRPLMALAELTPLSPAQPGERLGNLVGSHGNSRYLRDWAWRIDIPPRIARTPAPNTRSLSQRPASCFPRSTADGTIRRWKPNYASGWTDSRSRT